MSGEEQAAHFEALDALRQDALGEHQLSVESCANREQDLRHWLQGKIDAQAKHLKRLEEKILRAMADYCHAWQLDTQEVDASLDAGDEYRAMLASLVYQFGLESGKVRSRSFRFVMIDEAFGRGSDESARFGLELFRKLNLQLLIVTPLQKIHIIEPYVAHVGYVHNPEGRESLLRNLSIEEYRAERERRENVGSVENIESAGSAPTP